MFKVDQKVRDNQGQEGRVTSVEECEGSFWYNVLIEKHEVLRFPEELEAA